MTKIEAAGYIVHDNEVIWGDGATADAAWKNFRAAMKKAGVVILAAGQDSGEHFESWTRLGAWTRESDHTIRPATAGLLADFKARGGAISWGTRDGVACTIQEADEDAAAAKVRLRERVAAASAASKKSA